MQTGCTKLTPAPKEQLKDEVERYLTGNSEASDLVYFKLVPVVEQALETAARMLGSNRSGVGWR